MIVWIPVIGALLSAGASVADKILLGGKGITYKNYSTISFLAALFVAGLAFIIVRPPLTAELFQSYPGFLLIFTTATILASNLLYYHALKHDFLTEMEVVNLLAYVPIILFSFALFADERNLSVLFAALVASAAVIWSHWDKGHALVRKGTKPYLWWILTIGPLEAAAFKEIFTAWDPIALQFFRELIIVPILGFAYAETLRRVSPRSFITIFFTGGIFTLGSILFFISYERLGIIHTTLIFTIQPLLIYIGALLLLKEPFHRKKFIAFLIVLASIAAAQVIG